MISGLAKSEVMPRESEVFATAMSFIDEPLPVAGELSTTTSALTYSKKKAKKNRTTY